MIFPQVRHVCERGKIMIAYKPIFCYDRVMKNTIYFHIFKGEKQFVGEGVGIPVVTQGKTLDMLYRNIKEAVELYLESGSARKAFATKHPSVFMNIELSLNAKA